MPREGSAKPAAYLQGKVGMMSGVRPGEPHAQEIEKYGRGDWI